MAKHVTFTALDDQGEELAKSSLTSDGYPKPDAGWLEWTDYSKGEIDLTRLPEGVKKIKVGMW
jgi:hypothetical protein